MSIILNGTTGITTPGINNTGAFTFGGAIDLPGGTVGAPSLTTTGDLDTGIYFPAANQIAISTAGTQRVFVSATGDVGIGTGTPGYKLDVSGAIQSSVASGNGSVYINNSSLTGKFWTFIPETSSGESNLSWYYGGTSAGTRMTLTNTGNLGIGVTPDGNNLAKTIQLQDGFTMFGFSNVSYFSANAYYNSGWKYKNSAPAGSYEIANTHKWYVAASGTAGNAITFTQAMTLDSSSRLMVKGGTTAYGNITCQVNEDANNDVYLRNDSNGASSACGIVVNAAGNSWRMGMGSATKNSNALTWEVDVSAPAERMRLTTGGTLCVNTTGLLNNGYLSVNTGNSTPAARFYSSGGDGNICVMIDKSSSTSTTAQWFLGFTIANQATASGVITANGASQAAFGTWSDRRLKENVVDLASQWDNIKALHPVEFDYIESEGGGHQISFIAQEFEEIYPDAVGERPDGMKTLAGWGKTEARLVKALQEAMARIEQLEVEVAIMRTTH